MTMTYHRLQILESLSNLDSNQAEKVLEYIKDLSVRAKDEEKYKMFKHQAMNEIRMALTNEQLKASF
ncbi:MAG: hypothetical protein QM762_00425 [Chryseolinea sp.]